MKNNDSLQEILLEILQIEKENFKDVPPEKLSLKILGFGEISTVLQVQGLKEETEWVYKKLPSFGRYHQVERYKYVFFEYQKLLKEVGIFLLPVHLKILKKEKNKYILYIKQEKVNQDIIGNKLIHKLNNNDCILLLEKILQELLKVYNYNVSQKNIKIGIDGQISNWADLNSKIIYLDITSPLFRINNLEQLDINIFLKNVPSFLRIFIKKYFLKQVLDRYYDLRLIIVDLLSNFFKEKKKEIVRDAIEFSNNFLNKNIIEEKFNKLTYEEIEKYYKLDSFIWKFYQFCRKTDRFFITKILKKKYEIILPEKIER